MGTREYGYCHIRTHGGMTILRVTQIALLAAALVVGLIPTTFNGLSLLALVLAVAPLAIAHHSERTNTPVAD